MRTTKKGDPRKDPYTKYVRNRTPDTLGNLDKKSLELIKNSELPGESTTGVDQKDLERLVDIVFSDVRKDKRLTVAQRVFLIGLFLERGIITNACFKTKTPLRTHYTWMKNEIYAEYANQVKDYVVDLLETVLLDKAAGGNLEALKMVLQAKGGSRGYAKESTVTNNNIMPVQFIINFEGPQPQLDTPTTHEISGSVEDCDDLGGDTP